MFEDPNAGGGSGTTDPTPEGSGTGPYDEVDAYSGITSDPPSEGGGITGYQPDSDPEGDPPSTLGTVEG
jgi:hypothetical protein